ncbi:MAG: DNA-binding domain-containing protein [Burkholderiales bacterium]
MRSLPDLQRRFAAAIAAPDAPDAPGLGVYRNAVRANYRNALRASYPVVCALTGAPFFHAAVDAFATAHPSRGGDLNVYGGAFPDFLATYAHAQSLPYLPDVARLEWALDEAARAADGGGSPGQTLAALGAVPPDAVAHQRMHVDPTARLLHSRFPVLRIWQVHQDGFAGEPHVGFDTGPDFLLVRRHDGDVGVERVPPGEFAWLAALLAGADLAGALDAALAAEPAFDFAAALRARIADRMLCAVV